MKRKIMLDHGELKEVAELAGCSTTHARFCLRGAVKSELAKKVRAIALELGGVESNKN